MLTERYLWKFHARADWLTSHESELHELAPGKVAVIDQARKVQILVQVTCRTKAEAANLVRRFGGSAEKLSRDWQNKYLQSEAHAPLRIGRRLFILTNPGPDSRPQLVIPAAGAFGTGEHPTTAMSLRLLEETTRKLTRGWRLLDAGTGTGILALAARRFGAGEVLGLDLDPRAVAHARSNARLNKIGRAKFVRADILSWKSPDRFDIITANLFSELLIAALPIFRRALRRDGRLILSGILRAQNSSLVRALNRDGFRLIRQRRRGKWVALLAAPKT
jgi:ribosomal protein L11 methyltransferase